MTGQESLRASANAYPDAMVERNVIIWKFVV